MEDTNTPLDHHKNIPKISILSILLIIVMGITLLTLQKSNKNKQKEINAVMNPTTMPTVVNQKVEALQIDSPQTVRENENIILTIKVDSKNRDITAYDMLVKYDVSGLTYIKSESLVNGFNVYDYKNSDIISVTGVKSLTNKSPNIFSQTPLIKLTFKPLKKGFYTFSIPSEVGSEKTQLVDHNSQTIEAVEIQTTVTVN